ncbi:MAG: GntR family transcriptional regulator [Anaerotruncus sp.]|nr:GntR family transcriptional regulator [Anaerotruncus sp.]
MGLPRHAPIGDDLSQFVKTSLVDVVADRIRTNIYTGKYPAGKKLIVRELSDEFGVSHTPIKDALNRLIAEGYVEALPRRSMVVRTYTNIDLIESLQVRLLFEIFCAQEIVAAAQKSNIAQQLRGILEQMRECLADKEHLEYEKWVENETQFHRCYMQHCRNRKLFSLYQGLDTNKTTYFAYLNSSHTPLKRSTLESNLQEHEAITDAIEQQNAELFIQAVAQHLYRACEDYAVDDECRRKIEQFKQMTQKYLP